MAAHFAEDLFNWIFLNENILISTKMSLKFVPKGPIKIYSIGSDNGWAPTMWQVIIWTNCCNITDPYMRHSASMS